LDDIRNFDGHDGGVDIRILDACMSKRARFAAIWTALAIFATFVLIILGVDRYEAKLAKINWPLVSLICVFVFGGVALYRWNSDITRYNLIDMVMNQKTGKADPYKHLLFLFAGIAAWAIVQVVLAESWDTLTPLLTLVLGFFVLKPTVDNMSDAYASRPAPTPSDGAGNLQQVINAPAADTVNATPQQPVQPAPAEAATDVELPTVQKARKGKR
jgi:TctA family transporter